MASQPHSYRRRRRAGVAGGYEELEIKPASKDILLTLLLSMYFKGVSREVKHILLSLQELQQLGFSDTEQELSDDPKVQGFGTFVDQVCESSKQFAQRKERAEKDSKKEWEPSNAQGPMHPWKNIKPPESNEKIKESITARLETKSEDEVDTLHHRARVLLQAAGFLDIDKLVEYRRPEDTSNLIRKQGKVPQLQLEKWHSNFTPQFGPARCALCQKVLRGILFQCKQEGCTVEEHLGPNDYACEQCFRNWRHPQDHLVKTYKHCILDEVVTPQISRKLCHCTTVPKFDSDGNDAALYPVDPQAQHRHSSEPAYTKCRLFELPGLIAGAKERELRTRLETTIILEGKVEMTKIKARRSPEPTMLGSNARHEDVLDAFIPLPLRGLVSRFPFGNTHVSLMIGPLIIENGVPHSRGGGAFISSRDPLNYFTPVDIDTDLDGDLAICYMLNDSKQLFRQRRVPRDHRRVKACMKQIVGGIFSGYFNLELEDDIIQSLISESKFQQRNPAFTLAKISRAVERLLPKFKRLLGPHILIYLEKITARLYSADVKLRWNQYNNNCQDFCDTILPYNDFGGLFAPQSGSFAHQLYLMSFVVRNESYSSSVVTTKYDVPNGLTEEYLLGFRSGRHDDADIVDTLQEYWHDWGAFGKHLYKYQDVFPWDCTEAYINTEGHSTCGNCNIAKHVWAFPFDAWSIIQLHLQKDRRWYSSITEDGPTQLTDKEWMENRFKLFIAQEALLRCAVAMAHTPEFRASTDWFRTSDGPQFDRLKLGGIHRAQPFGHHFEFGRFVQPYLARWVYLDKKYRIIAYEHLRDERRKMADVGQSNVNVSPDIFSNNSLLAIHSTSLVVENTISSIFSAVSMNSPDILGALANVDPSSGIQALHAGLEGALNTDPTPVIAAAGTTALATLATFHGHGVISGFADALSGGFGF